MQVILPGATRTGLHEKIGLTREVIDWERFPSAEQVARRLQRRLKGRKGVGPLEWGIGSFVFWDVGLADC